MHTQSPVNSARRRALSIGRCVAALVLLGMVFITATPSEGTVFDRTRSLFLSQSCVNGQACLSLSSPPVSSAPATASTGSLTRAGGNLWQSAGVWGITLFEFRRDLVEGGYRRVLTVFPTSADIWLGLVGIDDPAATFDIRIDVVAWKDAGWADSVSNV